MSDDHGSRRIAESLPWHQDRYGSAGHDSGRNSRRNGNRQCRFPLERQQGQSKVIILLTDGTNNAGDISPLTAAEIAKSFGIRVYTIGVGTNGLAPYPMPVAGGVQYLNVPVEIDTKTLAAIAGKTDGEFYRATDNKKLEDVYKDIDKLEKTKLNVKQYSKRYEAYALVLPGWLLLRCYLKSCYV